MDLVFVDKLAEYNKGKKYLMVAVASPSQSMPFLYQSKICYKRIEEISRIYLNMWITQNQMFAGSFLTSRA